MLTDTHCHLNFEAFDTDRQEVIERSVAAGVVRMLNPAVDLETSKQVLELAERYPQVFAAIGVHPNEAHTWNGDTVAQLRDLAKHPKVVAIGEIGLDYYRKRASHECQKCALRAQLDLAAELCLPVILHNRQATEDLLSILSEWQGELARQGSPLAQRPGVLHSYSDDETNARRALVINFYIAFSGPVTFQNARDLQQVAAALPLEQILIETDAPFLTPHPYRGRRNEPAYVHYVAEKIAALRKTSLSEIAETTTANAARLFAW